MDRWSHYQMAQATCLTCWAFCPECGDASIRSEAKYICSCRKRLQAREIWPWGKGVFAGALGRYRIAWPSFFWSGVRNAAVIALRVLTVLQWQSSQWVENVVYGQAVQEVGSKGEETRPSKLKTERGNVEQVEPETSQNIVLDAVWLGIISFTSTTSFRQWHRQRGGYLWRWRSWKDFEGALQ